MMSDELMPIERLRNGWLCSAGERFIVLSISLAKAAIEAEESPQRAAQMLDELLRLAPADVVRQIPPMSSAAVRIVMETSKLDPDEGRRIVVDDEVKFVPVYPESFKLLTGEALFWDLAQHARRARGDRGRAPAAAACHAASVGMDRPAGMR